MAIRVVNGALVRELLPMDRCIDLMRRAHAMVARGETLQPVRQAVRAPGVGGLLGIMPGHIAAPSRYGAKIISVSEGNFGTRHGSHQGMVLLFETDNGVPLAMVDAAAITAIRTAAATAVATDLLARPDARTLGIFGYGEQARQHIAALTLVRDFDSIVVWGRDAARARAFAAGQARAHGRRVEATADPEAAARADVVCTVTSAATPFYRASWLRPGQHLNLVGASMPGEAEAEPGVIRDARCFYDFRDSALALAGEFLAARQAGLIDDDHLVGSVGDVIEAIVPGRRSPDEVTLFKSLGMIVQDMVAADHVAAEAARRDLGALIDW
jgi:ornithine cyclodeaminase